MLARVEDSSSIMNIQEIRSTASKFYSLIMMALVILNISVALISGRSLAVAATLSILAAVVALSGMWLYKVELPARIVTAAAFAVQMITLIYAASSLTPEYVQEAHMMYFIVNTFMIFYLCWRALLVYNLIVVAHHLILTFALPSLIWSTGASGGAFTHLVIHALIVLVSTPPLLLVAVKFEQAINGSVKAMSEAKGAAEEAIQMAETAAANQRATVEAQHKSDALKAKVERNQKIVVENLAKGLNALSNGDLTIHLDEVFPHEFEQLREDFNRSIEQLEDALQSISSSSSAIASSVVEMRNAADDLATRTEQQAASVEETAAALNEITAKVDSSCRQAEEAGQLILAARTSAEQSRKIVNDAVAAMGAIETSSNQISNIIGLIDEIAFQTNLLALNAGVEAARAGNAGKGFAVVAQEVRGLAQRSASAAKEIKNLINSSSEQVKHGVSLVGQTGNALEEIVGRIREISTKMSAIVESSTEQSSSLKEVNTAVYAIDQNTQRNSAMVEQSNVGNHALANEVEALDALIRKFKINAGASAASQKPFPMEMKRSSEPGSSPARQIMKKVVTAFGASTALCSRHL